MWLSHAHGFSEAFHGRLRYAAGKIPCDSKEFDLSVCPGEQLGNAPPITVPRVNA